MVLAHVRDIAVDRIGGASTVPSAETTILAMLACLSRRARRTLMPLRGTWLSIGEGITGLLKHTRRE